MTTNTQQRYCSNTPFESFGLFYCYKVEKLEKELQKQYDIYIEKYRNLDFLERESEKYRRHEEERLEEQEGRLKKTRERLLKEEVDLLRGGRGDGDDEYLGGVPVVRMGQTAGQYPTRWFILVSHFVCLFC